MIIYSLAFYISLEGDALGSFRNSRVPRSIMCMVTYVIACLQICGIFMITLGSIQFTSIDAMYRVCKFVASSGSI